MQEPQELDRDEPLSARRARHAYDRLIALSDGVFAIAITLLTLDIRPPQTWDGTAADLLAKIWRALFAYVLSFTIVAVYWNSHRRIFAMLRRVDNWTTAFNLLFLGLVALLPVVCNLLALKGPRGDAMLIYWAFVSSIGAVQALLWGYAALVAGLADCSLGKPFRWAALMSLLILPAMGAGAGLFLSRGSSPLMGVVAVLVIIALARGRNMLIKRLSPSS
jgi:uncharacterized membrane protein